VSAAAARQLLGRERRLLLERAEPLGVNGVEQPVLLELRVESDEA
jgi:hypothetical protein